MEETTKLICITCPKGCRLSATLDGKTIVSVEGNTCKRGADYVKAELTDPRRMVATTVRVRNGIHPLCPVYTAMPFPKPRIQELLKELRQVELTAPLQMGAVIVKNALDTGIDIITSRDLDAVEAD